MPMPEADSSGDCDVGMLMFYNALVSPHDKTTSFVVGIRKCAK